MPNRVSVRLFFLLYLVMQSASASYHKELWPKWEPYNPLSTVVVSHEEWQAVLSKYVTTNTEKINLVDYTRLKQDGLEVLKKYIDRMSSIRVDSLNRNEQLAYWINLYNALTVYTVAQYYPISSIQEIDISPGLFNIGPWGATLISIADMPLSLDEIYNRIVRPIWNDPRTHYAINNATIGAANLSKQAFLGASIDRQLNEAAAEFINSPRGVQIIEGKLVVSKIYDWYRDDFGGTDKDVIAHLKQFARTSLQKVLQRINNIDSYTYNWHLNSAVD